MEWASLSCCSSTPGGSIRHVPTPCALTPTAALLACQRTAQKWRNAPRNISMVLNLLHATNSTRHICRVEGRTQTKAPRNLEAYQLNSQNTSSWAENLHWKVLGLISRAPFCGRAPLMLREVGKVGHCKPPNVLRFWQVRGGFVDWTV